MENQKLLWILLAIFTLGCDKDPDDRLFWVTENKNNGGDFLFLTESANVGTLDRDSLKLFLTTDEYANLDSSSTNYKNYGKIHTSEKFKVFVLLRSVDSIGRDYAFMIRTYNNDWKIIDDFELGVWNDEKEKYCFGMINKELIIERKCGSKATPDTMQITDDGKIIMTSFNRP